MGENDKYEVVEHRSGAFMQVKQFGENSKKAIRYENYKELTHLRGSLLEFQKPREIKNKFNLIH